ncbi:MAG: ferredoxin, partial [Gammaproteobacteria bacterium]
MQLSGRAHIDWTPAPAARAAGAERLVRISIEQVNELPGGLPLRFAPLAAARRTLRIAAIEDVSVAIRAFTLCAADGGAL